MKEIILENKKLLALGKELFPHIRARNDQHRFHSPAWCGIMAEKASCAHLTVMSIGSCSFWDHEQRQWAQVGLDYLHSDPEQDAWLTDMDAHYLLRWYVTYYLKEWAEENALDMFATQSFHEASPSPQPYAVELAERFMRAWNDVFLRTSRDCRSNS